MNVHAHRGGDGGRQRAERVQQHVYGEWRVVAVVQHERGVEVRVLRGGGGGAVLEQYEVVLKDTVNVMKINSLVLN